MVTLPTENVTFYVSAPFKKMLNNNTFKTARYVLSRATVHFNLEKQTPGKMTYLLLEKCKATYLGTLKKVHSFPTVLFQE